MLRLSFMMFFRLAEVFAIALLFWLLQLWEQATLRGGGFHQVRQSRTIRPATKVPICQNEQSHI